MKKKLLMTTVTLTLIFTHCLNKKSYALENAQINTEQLTKGCINATTVNFRGKGNLDAKVYYTLDKNENIQVILKEDEWNKVIYDNKTGYVYSKYISEKDSVEQNIDYKTMNVTAPKWGTIAVDPKVIIFEIMKELDKIKVNVPIKIGDIIYRKYTRNRCKYNKYKKY